jgi:raffinose/stachyose/melibiose transport system permease protein
MRTARSFSYYNNTRAAVAFVLPAFLLYVFFVVGPVLQSFYFAFFDWKGMESSRLRFVGLQNFVDAFTNEFFFTALKNTLWFTLANPLLQLTVALALALALATYCRGYGFFKAVYFSPIILSSTAVALMWYFILLPGNGVLSSLLSSLGLGSWNRNWLVDRGVAFNWLIVINSWIYMGYYMIIFFAAVVSIDQEVLESARIDGSSGLHLVRKIILPMMWPIVIVAAVMQITGNLKAFDIVWILTKGGPFYQNNVLTTLLFYEMQAFHYGLASAYSVIVFVLSLVFTVVSLKIMNRGDAS